MASYSTYSPYDFSGNTTTSGTYGLGSVYPKPKFKVGDRVIIVANNSGHGSKMGDILTVESFSGDKSFYVKETPFVYSFEDAELTSSIKCPNHNCQLCYPERYIYTDPSTDFLRNYIGDWPRQKKMPLSTLAKKFLDSDIKILVKTGMLDECLNITSKGKDFVLAEYLADNKKKLAEKAKKLLKKKK